MDNIRQPCPFVVGDEMENKLRGHLVRMERAMIAILNLCQTPNEVERPLTPTEKSILIVACEALDHPGGCVCEKEEKNDEF